VSKRLGSPALRRIRSFFLPLNSPISSGSTCTDGCRRGEHFQLQRSEKSKAEHQAHIHAGSRAIERRSWEFLSVPNCATEVLVHSRRHGLVVLTSNVFAYHLRVEEAVTANAAMPLVAGEHIWTPLGASRVVFRIGHFNKSCCM
jgi:hypothetical protein